MLVANIEVLRILVYYTEYCHRMNKCRDSTAICAQGTKEPKRNSGTGGNLTYISPPLTKLKRYIKI